MQVSDAPNRFHSLDAEMAALGCALNSRAALPVVCSLTSTDFYYAENRAIYEAIAGLYAERRPVDLVTVDNRLTAIGGEAPAITNRVIDCARYVPTTVNVRAYVEQVIECSRRRQTYAALEAANAAILDPMTELDDVTDILRKALLDKTTGASDWLTMTDVMLQTIERFDALRDGTIRPLITGLAELDNQTGGFYPGELIIIGARTSIGKSAFAQYLAGNFAYAQHRKVCFCSREMDAVQYGNRMIARYANVDGYVLRAPQTATEADVNKIIDSAEMINSGSISFTFAVKHVEKLRAEVIARVERGEVDVLVVDYLQQLATTERFGQNGSEHLRISHISRILKEIALECNIPVIALAQVNRAGAGTMPGLENLKESGSIEQDADTVMLMHRPQDYEDKSIQQGDEALIANLRDEKLQYIVLKIAKNRQGKTGSIAMIYDPAHMRYACVERGK